MNVIKILGGLGNQMFQYSFFLMLKEENEDIKIDVSSFDNYELHNGIELAKVFGLDLSRDIIDASDNCMRDYKPGFKFRKYIGQFFYFNKSKFIKRTHFIENNYSEFNQSLLSITDTYLEGYWQNEKYFLSKKHIIANNFRWKNISLKNLELAQEMSKENSVALHIRRLDKIKGFKDILYKMKLLLLWRICPQKYYLDAIKVVEKNVLNPVFYIFTDNINWVERNFDINENFKIVDWNRFEDSSQDMFLMTQCKHNIISMSTFSWWGAWLNENPNKLVVSPKKWAVRLEKNMGIIPASWFQI